MRFVRIHPDKRVTAIDDDRVEIPEDKWPSGPVLTNHDTTRPVTYIQYDDDDEGGYLQQEGRDSRKCDIITFRGTEPIRPYLEAFAAEKKRLADEKAKQEAELEASIAAGDVHSAQVDEAAAATAQAEAGIPPAIPPSPVTTEESQR